MTLVSSMNSKTKFAKERQRFKIINDSIYGFWRDASDTIEVKISPTGRYTRIKVMDVNDPAILERISQFCGLEFIPKRTKWKGFDFVTHLVKASEYSYKDGLVHMPNTTRRNLTDLTVLDHSRILLDFFFIETIHKQELQNFVGSLLLIKNIPTEYLTKDSQ
jgi:hypothetical protein